jgi:formamidopyrimidine-DNA glycosylase
MPELPEVETIASALRDGGRQAPSMLGEALCGARLFWERTLATPAPEELSPRLTGQVIQEVNRRGKYLLIHLTKDILLIHLRMSGDLVVEAEATPVGPHHRLILDLQSGMRLSFIDARKFGRVWLVSDAGSVLESLGPEPLDPTFTPEMLYRRLQGRHRRLKPLLLDQGFLAGLGNIYTDEALHLARLHPLIDAADLDMSQARRLWSSIRQVLQEGIRRNGASIDWVYRGGDFQNYFRVYQRTGKPCPECGTLIQRIVVGQRGTHICPTCQPMPAADRQ